MSVHFFYICLSYTIRLLLILVRLPFYRFFYTTYQALEEKGYYRPSLPLFGRQAYLQARLRYVKR